MLYPEVKKAMQEVGQETVLTMKDLLTRQNAVASGNLRDTLTAKTIQADNELIDTQIEGADYAIFVDQGRKAGDRMPPVQAISAWINTRKISVSGKTTQQLAWAMAKSIAKKGIRARPFIAPSLGSITTTGLQTIQTAAAIDMNNNLQTQLDQKGLNQITI
jgi:hypothetical protein